MIARMPGPRAVAFPAAVLFALLLAVPRLGAQAAPEPAAAPDAAAPAAPSNEPATTFYATATVRERPLDSATAAVTVIDRAAIEASGAATVADVLRFAPGVDVTTNGRGGLTTAQIRGGEDNFTLVLLDGVPLNDPTYQVGDVFDLEGLPVAAVERIEIVRGPLSAFYGSTGLAGAIHVITRQGEAGHPTAELAAAAGNAALRQVEGSASGGTPAVTWFVGGVWEREAHRIAAERFREGDVHANAALALGNGARLTVKTRYAGWHGDDYPDASGGPVYGSGELRHSDHREMSLGSELTLGPAHKLSLALYGHDLDRDSPAVPPQVPASRESTAYSVARLGWASTLVARPGLEIAAGADVERERGDNRSLLLLPPRFGGAVRGDYAITRTLPGAYAELLATRGDLTFEAGSRFDAPAGHAVEWSPRLGVSWRPGHGASRLHASLGRAWKQPSFFALASPPQLGGNPGLRPETALGGDVGLDRTFAAGRADAGASLFYNRFDDLIDFDFASFRHVNRSRVEARGAELTLGWRPADRLSLHTDATWQEVADLTSHARLRHRPKWLGGARLLWQPADRLRCELDARSTARSFDEQIPVPARDTVPGYTLLGLTAAWDLGGPWQLRLRVDNLGDRRYETLIGFPGPGRAARLTLRWNGR